MNPTQRRPFSASTNKLAFAQSFSVATGRRQSTDPHRAHRLGRRLHSLQLRRHRSGRSA